MRIVCEQCQTKYIVPDEKIEKNVLRMTCQKCGHVITARVEKVSETADGSSSTLGKWRSTTLNTPRRAQNETPTWYYSYNGESFGPYTVQELKERFLSEKVSPIAEQCFVWHKSLTEWKPVLEVEPFASAILMPPPPPPMPKPVPKVQDENMPPLFPTGKLPTLGGSSCTKSSPDLLGLKQRLQLTSKSTNGSESSLFGKVEKNAEEQSDVPTHTAIPIAETLDGSRENSEEPGEATRVGAPSPFFSFQSLDAISPDIKAETRTGIASLSNPFPALTKPSSPSTAAAKPAFGGSANPVPGISSLFANKSSGTNNVPRFAGLRSMSSQSEVRLQSVPSEKKVLNATSTLSAKSVEPILPPTSITPNKVETELPDFKEDIGSIVSGSAPSPFVPELNKTDNSRSDSISSWLPSQSSLRIDSKLDGFSVSDISMAQNFLDNSSAKDSLPSLDFGNLAQKLVESEQTEVKKTKLPDSSDVLPDIDLDESEDDEKTKVVKASSEEENTNVRGNVAKPASTASLPAIDLDGQECDISEKESTQKSDNPSQNAISDGELNEKGLAEDDVRIDSSDALPDIDLEACNSLKSVEAVAASSSSSDILPDIDIDDEDSQLVIPEAVEEAIEAESVQEDEEDAQKMESAVNLLSNLKKKSTVTKTVSETSSAAELNAIDLEADNGQLASENFIEAIPAEGDEQKTGRPEFDALFEPNPEDSSLAKARSSQASLDEIAARHSDLFAESEKIEKENAPKNESGVSENSMLIQLEHFQKAQEKDKRKKLISALVIAFIVVVLCSLIGTFSYIATTEDKVKEEEASFAKNAGSKISTEELQIDVPEDDFEILDMNTAKPKSASNGTKSNSGKERAVGSTEAAAEAIYGGTEAKAKEEAKPAVRADGRSSVVLQNNTDSFADTAGVQGSKYAVKGNSRDMFAIGLKRVSTSVQDCSRRVVNKGYQMPPKIYLNLVIQPDGTVSSYEIQDSEPPSIFNTCLKGKVDTWKFTPFDGTAVKIKQAFILG